MNLKKKIILATCGALSVLTLAACSNSDAVVSMKGDKITKTDIYDEMKNSSSSTFQQVVQQTVIYGAFQQMYKDDVTDKDVDAKFDEVADSNGGSESFASILSAYGYTEDSYKKALRQSLAFQAGLEANAELTDADYETAWESFHPEVEAQIITTASEDDAKAALEEINGGTDFAEVAKDKSTDTTTKDDGGTVKFDSQDTTIPADVQTAAYALEDGKVSDIITVTDSTYGTSTYYIVKMVKNQAKGNSMDPYKDELKEIAMATKTADSTFQTTTIKKVLKDANVKVLDNDLEQYFTEYLSTESSSDSSTAESTDASTAETETSTSGTTESSTATSATTESSTATSTSASK